LGKPLIAVNTLAALASAASQQVEGDFWTFCPLIDARRMEVYTAVFDKNLNELEPPQALIVENDDFWAAYFAEKNKVLFFGDGAAKCEAVILHEKALFLQSVQAIRGVIPLATAAFEAQKFQDVAYFEPFYLKSPNITKPKQILKPIY
jgi:tRNA threonylcarbamoyladenosine biosynthesis protein TsaB